MFVAFPATSTVPFKIAIFTAGYVVSGLKEIQVSRKSSSVMPSWAYLPVSALEAPETQER